MDVAATAQLEHDLVAIRADRANGHRAAGLKEHQLGMRWRRNRYLAGESATTNGPTRCFHSGRRLDATANSNCSRRPAVRRAARKGNPWVARWLRFGRRGIRWPQDPERAARRTVFRLASQAMPTPMRQAIWLLRGLTALRSRGR